MKKLNNKGFSLIELIIVMAIMAILTVAIAPQYLKYVERSRKSTDVQTVASIITAIDIYAADPVVGGLTPSTSATLALTEGGSTAIGNTSFVEKALQNAGITSVELKSKQWRSSDDTLTITATVGATGAVTYDADEDTGLDIIKGVTSVSGS